MGTSREAVLQAAGRDVVITNPDKVFFPRAGHTKLDLARYYAAVADAALALAREVERRIPDRATGKWWKEERHGVFLDYNQNARDRTVASAWSVRPTPDARVSMRLAWDEVADCDPAAFTLVTAPTRGDAAAGIDDAAGSLDGLLALSAAQEAAGLGDAPWPPHHRKQDGEPPRVAPSRRKRAAGPTKPDGGRRTPSPSLVIVAKARHEPDALAGLERWKARHPSAAGRLEAGDVLVDSMRGRSSTWTRIRVNLRHVPEDERPAWEAPDPDYDPWRVSGARPGSRAPKTSSSS